jgi:toxin ParE1/3/4
VKRTVRLLEVASEEAVEAAGWYEGERPGLGAEFHRALETALGLLEGEFAPVMPVPGALGERGAKRLILNRFPFDVVFQDRGQEIVVLAVAHHSRQPGYWRDRL